MKLVACHQRGFDAAFVQVERDIVSAFLTHQEADNSLTSKGAGNVRLQIQAALNRLQNTLEDMNVNG